MLKVELDHPAGVALVEPRGELTEADFYAASQTIDLLIQEHGKLNGLIIHTKSFPGWASFSVLFKQLQFVRDHHRKIRRVALVTDSPMGNFAERVARHFSEARVKTFAYHEFIEARKWVEASSDQ